MVIIDRGANTKENKASIRKEHHHYLCSASLSAKVDKQIEAFDKSRAEVVEEKNEQKTYCAKYEDSDGFNYLYFSEKLYSDSVKRKRALAQKQAKLGKELEQKLLSKRKKKKLIQNTPNYVVEEKVELQRRLAKMSCNELEDILYEHSIDGREGFFLLKSSKNLTPKEALTTYRNRDVIEKLMDSIKNTICIKPVRVWTDNAIKGAILIGFLAQLILAMFQYNNKDLHKYRHITLLHSLRNLTLTIEYLPEFIQKHIISNIDNISKLIFDPQNTET